MHFYTHMMDTLPIWALGLLIFCLRIIDVSMGTLRMISVVNGRLKISVVLGFFEVAIWISAISQVISKVKEHPYLVFAFAGGFACGNGVGMLIERRIGIGSAVVRMISLTHEREIIECLRALGQVLTTFRGEGRDGPRTLIYAICGRRDLRRLLQTAKRIDPQLIYVVERVSEASALMPLPNTSAGWQALSKRK